MFFFLMLTLNSTLPTGMMRRHFYFIFFMARGTM